MNRLIEIDEQSYTVTAQAGINGQHLEWELNRRGPHARALPGITSRGDSGRLSRRARLGRALDQVRQSRGHGPHAASGSFRPVRRSARCPTPNHATGPGLLQLFVGSEGTLGVITEATMRVDPLPPVRRFRS